MSITYEHKYDVKNIYNAFKKNRVNAVSYLGTSNNEKLEPDSSAYLSYANSYVNNSTYIYARKSSPTINSDTDKNYAYLKVGNTTYNFYHGHAYTYTETVTGNGVKPILIAYDFVNKILNTLKFDEVSISHNAAPISDIPQTVNVFSPVSYIIENVGNSLDPKNEYSISSSNINTLLDGSTFADFTTYVTYSYLNSEKGDGIVYEDGKDTLSTNPINDIHVWSLSDGVDMTPHAYVNNDTTAVNAYTYLNCGNILNTFFRNNISNIFDDNSNNYKYIKFYYDDISIPNTNRVLQRWKAGIVGTDKIYAKDVRTGDNILDYSTFYKVCKVESNDVSSFNEIYNKPSLRNNSDEINCYININGESNSSENQESHYINKSNTNKALFVKKINNLPVHILSNTIDFTINLNLGGHTGIGANDSPTNGYIQNFKLILLENEQNSYGYKEYSIPLKIELYPYNRYDNVRSMKVTSVTKPESIDDNEYEINNWQQSPSNINDDVEQYKFTFELKILDDKLKDIFSHYEDENLLLKILDLQFEASGSCTGRDDDDAKIIFSAVGKNCLSEKTNSEYEYNTFRITRSTSNGYLSSINIDITYGDSLNN